MNNENWLKHYRTNKNAIWIKCKLTNGEELFYPDHTGWLTVKRKCRKHGVFLQDFRLQFRSHEVIIDIPKAASALYFIRSVMGTMGGASNQYYTTGVFTKGKMNKQMWLIPELIVEKELSDNIDECFEEAIIQRYKPLHTSKK